MKATIYKILFFIVIILIVDFLAGIILKKLYSHPKSGIAFQENYIFNETNEDILIFGSSRAAFHYSPSIISNKTQLSVYNAGREGTGIFFSYAALLGTLDRYTPKVVILDLDFRDFYLRGGNFGPDVFKELLPYYGEINHQFDSLVTPKFYDRIFCFSNLYRYNKKFFNVVSGSIGKTNVSSNGHKPLKGEWDGVRGTLKSDNFEKSEDLVKTLRAFIKKGQENDVELIIVLSPSFKKIPPEFDAYVASLHSKDNVKVLNHLKDKTFLNHREYFKDEEHLNSEGAKIFSEIIGIEVDAFLKRGN